MKLYTSGGPNPRVVQLFLAEKGLAVEAVQVDVAGAENRRQPYLDKNPLGQLPTLETDEGAFVSQVTAICELVEELHPAPPLIGTTPSERAATRMWMRRIDLEIVSPMVLGFRGSDGADFYRARGAAVVAEGAVALKALARAGLGWLDGQLGDQPFVCGARFTLADILLFAFTEFGERFGQPLDPAWPNLARWFGSMTTRFAD